MKNNIEESKSPQVKENHMLSKETKTKYSDCKNGVGKKLETKGDKIESESSTHVSENLAKSITNIRREFLDIDEKICKDIIIQVQMFF